MISESRSHDLALAPTRCGSSTTDNTLPIAKNVPPFLGLFLSLSFFLFLFFPSRYSPEILGFLRGTSSCNCNVTWSIKPSTSSEPSAHVTWPIVAVLSKDFNAVFLAFL